MAATSSLPTQARRPRSQETAPTHEPSAFDLLIDTLTYSNDEGLLPDSISDLLAGWFIENLIAPETGETPDQIRQRLSASEPDPSRDASFYFDRGLQNLRDGEFDLAIADFTKAIELQPDNEDFHNARRYAYFESGQLDRTIADYTAAIEADPDNAWLYRDRAATHERMGNNDLAIADFTKSIELRPDNADFYHDRGWRYYFEREYDLAIADFTKAIELEPDNGWHYNARGVAYRDKEIRAAIMAAGSDIPWILPGLASSPPGLGVSFDNAIADFDRAIEADLNSHWPYGNRGLVRLWRGEFDLAIQDANKGIEINPNHERSYRLRGRAYMGNGEYHLVIQDATKSIDMDPNNGFAYRDRGLAHFLKGEYQKAIRTSIRLYPW